MALHPDTYMGEVHLTSTDLQESLFFYQFAVGMTVLRRTAQDATLGVAGRPLVRLTEVKGAPRADEGTTGLFHFALRVPTRFDLARSLYHLSESGVRVSGADHAVSEAIYFSDPDGSGIEIYRDRPRESWTFTPQGVLKMGTEVLDFAGILGELGDTPPTWTGLHPYTIMGHVHLRAARLDESESFYRDAVGFDLMLRYGGQASFLSAGGYHHHLGINTWAGVGAPQPLPGTVGLRWYTVHLHDDDERAALIARLNAWGAKPGIAEGAVIVHDPSGIEIRFL
jgi:catechol 2,3-dioxygenase